MPLRALGYARDRFLSTPLLYWQFTSLHTYNRGTFFVFEIDLIRSFHVITRVGRLQDFKQSWELSSESESDFFPFKGVFS